ncbi:hypothetical protein HMPREF0083_00440 [Aneurinibacillus aneurinilyticus ATCC 12856]|uniref:Uncharacterized protein n=1 Tax=Aneurinibacillus aneurinilyticus ATCC 12856 TaxID=649747 RepID=U1XA75_ANEAE|nr:hypothetical protein HMPREF0083_00440 [Aneurinibacillus aneurinilyticus ATCC 12856]
MDCSLISFFAPLFFLLGHAILLLLHLFYMSIRSPLRFYIKKKNLYILNIFP